MRNYFFIFIATLMIAMSCTKETLEEQNNEKGAFSSFSRSLDCSRYIEPDNSTYENLRFSDMELSELTSENIGLYHNVLLNDFLRDIEYGSVSFNQLVDHYEVLIPDSEDISFDGYESINNLDVDKPSTLWLPENAGFSQQEFSYFRDIVDIINNIESVEKTQQKLEDLKDVISSDPDLTPERKEVMFIGISVGKSSYKFWAPMELGGDDNERRVKCYLDKSIDKRKWGEWFAKTATADITGGLAAAGRTAFLAATGVGAGGTAAAGVFGAAVSSTTTGIMSWP